KESGTCISAGTLPMIRIKNTRGLSVEIFSGTSPEMLCHLIKAFTHAE
ncbi:IS66 family insertion sequence element accessory protein TnpB, partial [Fusicatenibacter saccharivorans]|nr:IS66 family insertion sequence element accessory protein TnpB [Fusicatenibacter saccharivorans]